MILTWCNQNDLPQGSRGSLKFKEEWYGTSESVQDEETRASSIALTRVVGVGLRR